MDCIRYLVLVNCCQHVLSRCDVVADEWLYVWVSNLGLQHDYCICPRKVPRPLPGFRQVGVFDDDIGVESAQYFQIGLMLVEHDEIGVALALQQRNEILANQAGSTGKNNFFLCHSRKIQLLPL